MVNSNFVTDAELTGYINNSISELHDMLIQAYDGDYYINEVSFQTAGSVESYSIASLITAGDFYKLRGIDAKLNGSEWFTLKQFNFNERNKNQATGLNYGLENVRYRLVGSTLRLTPVPDNNITCKIWYIPLSQTLTSDSDSYADFNNFSEYVIVDAAIKMLQKEESDATLLLTQKAALKRRIEEAAGNREVGNGESISDVYAENNDYYYGNTR
jgi:hypothetical protein